MVYSDRYAARAPRFEVKIMTPKTPQQIWADQESNRNIVRQQLDVFMRMHRRESVRLKDFETSRDTHRMSKYGLITKAGGKSVGGGTTSMGPGWFFILTEKGENILEDVLASFDSIL